MVSGDLEGPANGERDGDIDEDPCLNRKGRRQSPFWFGRLGDLEGLADGVSDRDSMRQSLETGPAPASGNTTLLSRAWNYQHDDGKPLDDACQLGWSGRIISTCFQIFATDKQHGLNPTMTISPCQPPPREIQETKFTKQFTSVGGLLIRQREYWSTLSLSSERFTDSERC
eukprot:scaffold1061_cov65-Cyclotella_meneghiniana.AAC.6